MKWVRVREVGRSRAMWMAEVQVVFDTYQWRGSRLAISIRGPPRSESEGP